MAKPLPFCELLFCCLALSAAAHGAEEAPAPMGTFAELMRSVRASDPGSGRFQLELPVIGKPVLIAWEVGSAPTYESLRWSTYKWEAHLLGQGPMSLVGFNRLLPAPELNCLASTCQPTQERTIGAELRLGLGGRGVVPNNHLFLRGESVRGSLGHFPRVKLGIAGAIDL